MRLINRRDLEQQIAGVECREAGGVIDEIPGAYTDIDEVMANQADLVDLMGLWRLHRSSQTGI